MAVVVEVRLQVGTGLASKLQRTAQAILSFVVARAAQRRVHSSTILLACIPAGRLLPQVFMQSEGTDNP
ncbi:TPA: hypothetical protein HA318_03960 [Candidatus Micrarchaeota archaeon]|nr:hypothetical protein [Candidatus Micrarchaeota archaeon]